MSFIVSTRIINLVEKLLEAGYGGEATLDNSYCTGTAGVLGKAISVKLTGFCKECLHLVEDTESGEMVAVGRYSIETTSPEFSVEDVVSMAWTMYKSYKDRGYSRPHEFEDLFKKFGYLTERSVTKTVIDEQ